MHTLGIILLMLVILFMIGAGAAAYFRTWPHSGPEEQLRLIATDRLGWTAQAVIFPLVFVATALLFFALAQRLPAGGPRWLGWGATVLLAASALLWLPISINRIRFWATAVALLAQWEADRPVEVNFGLQTFWAHTSAILLAITLMGAALAWSQFLPITGWLLAGLALASLFTAHLVWHDWPPFLNYLLLLLLAIALMIS